MTICSLGPGTKMMIESPRPMSLPRRPLAAGHWSAVVYEEAVKVVYWDSLMKMGVRWR